MIVGTCFEGDTRELAGRQHDVYWDAIRIIVDAVRTHLNNAAEMLNIDEQSVLPADSGVDHRTLQTSHDLLAAAWRFQCMHVDLYQDEPDASMSAWLQWLRKECQSWHAEPGLVRSAGAILFNQNNEKGYEAEDDFATRLRKRFREVR